MTGLGLPSEMAGCVDSGATKSFAIWTRSTSDMPQLIAHNINKGARPSPVQLPMGRMGKVTLDDSGSAAMSDPFTYDSSNIDQFKSIFRLSVDSAGARAPDSTFFGGLLQVEVVMQVQSQDQSGRQEEALHILALEDVTKTFPGVKALSEVSLRLYPGQVTALIGENGAGKSTVVKILTGIYQPNAGKIVMDGQPVQFPATRRPQAPASQPFIGKRFCLTSCLCREHISWSRAARKVRPHRLGRDGTSVEKDFGFHRCGY